MAAFDVARDRLVVFGGERFIGAYIFLNDTWELNPTTLTWTQRTVAGPSARALAAMAYDPVRQVTVLFGGRSDFSTTPPLSDTWEWTGAGWRQPAPATVPPGRSQAHLVWDGSRQRIVLFGGFGSGTVALNDVWEFDGTNWQQRTNIGVGPQRAGGTLVYDSVRSTLVLVGGVSTTNVGTSTEVGVWELGASWLAPVTTGTTPPGRYATSGAFDRGTASTVLIGGTVSNVSQSGSYFLTGSVWNSNPAPTASAFTEAEFDPLRGRIYVFGGLDSVNNRLDRLLVY